MSNLPIKEGAGAQPSLTTADGLQALADATILNIAFHNQNNYWDNNRTSNYNLEIK